MPTNFIMSHYDVLVCYLEYLGLCELLGEETAHAVLRRAPVYKAIYQLVMTDSERIGAVVAKYGLIPDDKPPENKQFIDVG